MSTTKGQKAPFGECDLLTRDTMLTLLARSYENGEPVRISIAGRRIRSVEPAWPSDAVAVWPYVAPALFDLQINGHQGIWFSNDALTREDVLKALEPHYRYGITRLCPTLITNSFEGLAVGFAAIREACESNPFADQHLPAGDRLGGNGLDGA